MRARRPDDPHLAIGAWLPMWSVRLGVAAVGAGLALASLPAPFAELASVLAVVAGAVPRTRTAWLLIVLLAIGQGARGVDGIGAGLFVLLLGVHVLHVLAAYALVLPIRGRLQLAALLRPARGIVLVQVPVQALAAVLLLLTTQLSPAPGWAVTGAAALLLAAGALLTVLRSPAG